MIKHILKENLISISIPKKDFSYRIPVEKIGNTVDWKIGKKNEEGIVIKNVSAWTLQLFTKNVTEEKYVNQFKNIVQEFSPKNSIDWEDTFLAVTIQNRYNWLMTTNATAANKMEEQDIIADLKKKYKLS
ncbi:hypothetical protein DNU06_06340 [Putridiphycobacter roseus]|uniref:Uncharacterized protein n=1 Tax=Putridiphycobacter roseus TaxID=2219161 RepID=A0A2W1NEB6_9FLAO|nr:hypothetical protein [Putridiphycobacter roseus]PZE17443.1 hypothetical protein DNU06_06340 [Putridiphycobacter roseus]